MWAIRSTVVECELLHICELVDHIWNVGGFHDTQVEKINGEFENEYFSPILSEYKIK